MTHSIDAPFPPPPTTTWGATSGTTSSSTTDVAKDEARNVGQTAAEAGSHVASTAADQAKEVVHETQQQAMNLLDQGRSQVREQAATQQQKAAQGLNSLADELRGMVYGTGLETSGPAHDLLKQATGKVEDLAGWLQGREPGQLLDEVRSFARRKPGTFLLGAALAGVVAGRLTRGVQASHSGNGSGGTHRAAGTEYPPTRYAENYVEPSPAYPTTPSPVYPTPAPAYPETAGVGNTAAGTGPLPPPPYGTVPPSGSVVPPAAPAGWDDPTRRPGEVG